MLHPSAQHWSPAAALEEMDAADISLSLLSVSTPAASFLPPDAAAKLARECNDYTAQLVQDYPGRFAIVGTLPMPHIEESLAELDYLYGKLNTAAIGLMTNYDQKWLGHPSFDRIFAALNERHAAVHVHPSMTNPGVDAARAMGLPPPVVEYSTDTTRTIANLVFTGAAEKFTDVKLIFSHGGGTMPYLIERFTGIARSNPQYAAFTAERVLAALRRFYYDVAIVAHPAPLAALTELIPASQIVYGSDSPYRSPQATNEGIGSFLDQATLQAILRDNSLRIMPSLKNIITD